MYYCCSINLKRESERSGLRPDTTSLVDLMLILLKEHFHNICDLGWKKREFILSHKLCIFNETDNFLAPNQPHLELFTNLNNFEPIKKRFDFYHFFVFLVLSSTLSWFKVLFDSS